MNTKNNSPKESVALSVYEDKVLRHACEYGSTTVEDFPYDNNNVIEAAIVSLDKKGFVSARIQHTAGSVDCEIVQVLPKGVLYCEVA